MEEEEEEEVETKEWGKRDREVQDRYYRDDYT